jgi:hypothetical protein
MAKHGMRIALMPAVFMLLIVAVVISVGPNIFGNLENEYDYTNDSYQSDYDGMTDLIHVDTAILMAVAFMLVLGLIIIVLLKFT